MKSAPRISEAEWTVMKVLWRQAPCLAQEVIEALAASRRWTPATIKTLLNRLVRKGALRFTRQGNAYVYAPSHREEEFRAAEADSFLQRVFDGALSPMLSHFVQSRSLSARDLEALEKIVKERRKEK